MRSSFPIARKLGFLVVALSLAGCSGAANLNPTPQVASPSQSQARTIQSNLPATKDDCKNGGWQSFSGFKNQGDCVSFVATGGKNPPDLTLSPIVATCGLSTNPGATANSPAPLTCVAVINVFSAAEVVITEANYTGSFTASGSTCNGPHYFALGSIPNGSTGNSGPGVFSATDTEVFKFFTCLFTVSDTNGQSMTITFQGNS